jgi:DNA primase
MLKKPDIISVLEQEGVELHQRGHAFWALCPLPDHEERTPSFKVDPDRQFFYCFGCSRHGDVIDLIRQRHGLSFMDALAYLGIKQGKSLLNSKVIVEDIERRELIAGLDEWVREHRNLVINILREYRRMKAQEYATEKEMIMAAEASADLDWVAYIYEDILCKNNMAAHLELFKMEHGL